MTSHTLLQAITMECSGANLHDESRVCEGADAMEGEWTYGLNQQTPAWRSRSADQLCLVDAELLRALGIQALPAAELQRLGSDNAPMV